MNPSKVKQCGMGSTSKIPKHAYLQPGFLARGRGQSLRSLGSLRVNAEKRSSISKNTICNALTSMLNEMKQKNWHVHHIFYRTEDDVTPYEDAEMIQDAHRSEIRSCVSVKAKKVTGCAIVSRKNYRETLKNISGAQEGRPPCFDPMEDGPFYQEAKDQEPEVMPEAQGAEIRSCVFVKANKVTGCKIDSRKNHRETLKNISGAQEGRPPRFDPMEDSPSYQEAEVMPEAQGAEISPCESEKAKKVRGKNICKDVAKLKPGEKLSVTFYHNRVVGPNHKSSTRHLGLLISDSNTCPLRVHSWKDIEQHKLEHMWEAVTEKFDSDDMNDHKDNVLDHMRKLWNNWRGSLHKIVKSKPLHVVLKDVPEEVNKTDWEWLVNEHFLSDKFKEASARNSVNRSKLRMPHRTGSKPIREIIYQKGGKDGKPPDMATIFFETRKKDNLLVEPETNEKYAEIKKLVESEPSLTHIEVVERCFGPQCKSHAVGFGGGITAKELKGGNSSKAALLEELKATRKEKEALQKRIDKVEGKVEWMESLLLNQAFSSASSSEQ